MKIIYAFFLSLLLLSAPAHAEDKLAIVATVGDEAITNKDLLNRLKIMIMSSGGQGDPETVNKLKPKALQQLIDEKMYVAEATKLKYKVTKGQINEAISTLEKQNNMPEGGLLGMLKANDVPEVAMDEKLTAEISHAFLIAREVSPKIVITDAELDDFLKAETQVTTREEYLLKEIVLPINLPEDDAKMLTLARDLKAKIQAGENFEQLAQKNSQSPSATKGGNVGWLDEKQIPQEIMTVVKSQGLNKILGPIKSVEGYYLIIVQDHRTITSANDNDTVELRQFYKLPKAQKEVAPIQAKIASLNNIVEGCLRAEAYAKTNDLDVNNFSKVRIGDLPGGIQNILTTLETGKFSAPVSIPTGIATFLLCERAETPADEVSSEQKEKAKDLLKYKKTDLAAQKYMRNLRQKTNIDVRL